MNAEIMYSLAKDVYSVLLRELIRKEIDDPNSTWDNVILNILDSVFDFKYEKEG